MHQHTGIVPLCMPTRLRSRNRRRRPAAACRHHMLQHRRMPAARVPDLPRTCVLRRHRWLLHVLVLPWAPRQRHLCIDDNAFCDTPNGNDCHEHATCSKALGSFLCTCNAGFSGSGVECSDVDECAPQLDAASQATAAPCSSNAFCNNSLGSFSCTCLAGFVGNGTFCSECSPGHYKQEASNTLLCESCPRNTYQDASAATACLACSNHTSSPPASPTRSNCVCVQAFSGPDGGNCTACAAGTYKSINGSSSCIACSNFSDSPPQSSEREACRCNAGYRGPDGGVCDACVGGTYKDVTGSARCITCPDASDSAPASEAFDSCLCRPGYVANQSSIVMRQSSELALYHATFLAPLTYTGLGIERRMSGKCRDNVDQKVVANESQCRAAADIHFDSMQVYVGEASKYTWGGTRTVAGEAEGCIAMQVRDFATCGDGTITSEAVCRQMANDLGFNFLEVVVNLEFPMGCLLTELGNAFLNTAPTTVQCAPNKLCLCQRPYVYFNKAVSSQSCTAGRSCLCLVRRRSSCCSPGLSCLGRMRTRFAAFRPLFSSPRHLAYSLTHPACRIILSPVIIRPPHPASSFCTRVSRLFLSQDKRPIRCYPCAQGSYNPHQEHDKCYQCPEHSRSLAGSTSPDQCLCEKGYSGEKWGNCTICPVGKYKDTVGSASCTDCPPHSSTVFNGSTGLSDCMCNAGYFGQDASVCAPCLADTYKPLLGTQECDTCPANTEAPAGSIRITSCICQPRFFAMKLGVACELCPPYTWKNFSGSTKCSPCPQNTRSPAGSFNLENCSCINGHVGLDGQACAPCSAGKYKAAGGSAACSDCPEHMTSPAGSYYILDCNCKAGFYGRNGQSCWACAAGKYKEVVGSEDCVDCFAYSTSPAGSNSSFQCLCNPGFVTELPGVSCLDVDECAQGTHACSPMTATCINTPGSFSCACMTPWFAGNETSCRPESTAVQVAYIALVETSNLPDASLYASTLAELLSVDASDVRVTVQVWFYNSSAPLRRLMFSSANASQINASLVTFVVHVETTRASAAVNASNDLAAFNLLLVSQSLHPMFSIQQRGRIVAECGNGLLETAETCDDGNQIDGDGCSSACYIEEGWLCQPDDRPSQPHNRTASLCADVNECLDCLANQNSSQSCKPIAQCNLYASCINLPGSFLCACKPGFLGDGLECVDDLSNNDTLQRNTMFSRDPVRVLLPTATGAQHVPNFGIAVSLSRDAALVGSEGSSIALLFERDFEGEWHQHPIHTFSAPASSDPSAIFGNAVSLHMSPSSSSYSVSQARAIRASCAAIGSSNGAVYVYHKEAGANWGEAPSAVLTAPEHLFFGASIALSYDELLVGVPGSNLAFVFLRPGRSKHGVTEAWPSRPTFRLDGHTDILMLGQNVALSQSHAAVASYSMTSVVVFRRAPDGSWPRVGLVLQPRTPPTDPTTSVGSSFGIGLSLSQSFLVVGDPLRRLVTIFALSELPSVSLNATALARTELQASDGGLFADCVSNTDLYMVVGARGSNRAYLYKSYLNGTWPNTPAQVLTYHAPFAAASVGTACVINNQDVMLPSFSRGQGRVFVHSSACALGFYGLSSDHCHRCPAGTSSIEMARLVSGCRCLPGTLGPGGGPCRICPKNRYCPGGNDVFACPSGTTSRNGSSSESDCESSTWLLKSMAHSTSLAGADNRLQLNVSLNIQVEASDGMTLTITGLTCGSSFCEPCATGLALTSSMSTRSLTNAAPHAILSDACSGCGLVNGSLVVQHMGHTLESEVFGMSFCLKNPLKPQPAPVLTLTAGGLSDSLSAAIDGAAGSSAPLAIMGVARARGFQSRADQAARNLVTVSLTLLAVAEPGTQIRVLNLSHADMAAGGVDLRNGSLATSPAFCSSGTWESSEGRLVAPICSETASPVPLTLQFILRNVAHVHAAARVGVEIVSKDGVIMHARSLDLEPGKSAEERIGVVAGFWRAHVGQTSSAPSSMNELGVTLISSAALYRPSNAGGPGVGARITVAGLTGSATASGTPLALELTVEKSCSNSTCDAAESWSALAYSWYQHTGTLVFQLDRHVAAGHQLSVRFSIQNPRVGQRARQFVTVESNEVRISAINMTQGDRTERVLVVAGLVDVSAGQSSPCPADSNTITLNFKVVQTIPYNVSHNESSSSGPFFATAEFLVTGLTGTRSNNIASASLTETGSGSALAVTVVSWDQVNGTLVVSLGSGVEVVADVEHSLQFSVINSLSGQDAVQVQMAGRAGAAMSMVPAASMEALSAPLRVYGVRAATMTQSSARLQDVNTLTLRLRLHVPLPDAGGGGILVTITGLTGTATASSAVFAVSQQRQALDTRVYRLGAFDSAGRLFVTFYGLSDRYVLAGSPVGVLAGLIHARQRHGLL